jgi:hypothetical protein
MATTRPHFSASGPQLQKLFEANRRDARLLRELLAELRHRKTPTSHALRREVEEALAALKGGPASETSDKTESSAVPPKPYPSHHTVSCRGCGKSLRVPVRPERTSYSCPTCRCGFETVFKDGVLQVVWVETKSGPKDSAPMMTDVQAREILGVPPSADFAAIKAAWRKASQQYHPDKHEGLPERLRKAAEVEMKRINEAYRFLEASTAGDF